MYFHCKSQASTLYANNLSKLLLSMAGTKDHYHLDMADDVVRGSIVLNKGAMAWPPNPPISGKKEQVKFVLIPLSNWPELKLSTGNDRYSGKTVRVFCSTITVVSTK